MYACASGCGGHNYKDLKSSLKAWSMEMLLVFRPRFRLFLFGTIFVDLRRYFSNFPEYLGTPYGHSQWLYVQHAGTPKSYMRYSVCYCRNSELLHMNLDNDKIHYHNGVDGHRGSAGAERIRAVSVSRAKDRQGRQIWEITLSRTAQVRIRRQRTPQRLHLLFRMRWWVVQVSSSKTNYRRGCV